MSQPEKKCPANEPGDAPIVPAEAIPLRWVRVSHHTPDHIAARYPYAAYGSNLSLEQMSRRCPTCDIIGPGTLRNAKVFFAYYMGVAEAERGDVPMAVYKMLPADVAAMDRHEGLGRSYERYLVTVEIRGVAVRCFTYVKRDNRLEEPNERYYTRCLQGYNDWNFDTRRLRHAKEDARKNGIKRTYSSGYGFWDGKQTSFDWDKYRKGSRNNNPATIPAVRDYDPKIDGSEEPEGNGTAASYHPKISHVTGRELPSSRRERERARNKANGRVLWGEMDDPARVSKLNESGQTEFVGKDGQRWVKGANGFWHRAG